MRKIITSSVLILLFSLFSGSVFAGKIEACENIKHDPAYKGLYGLCNAYWNADENAQDKILAKFEKKAGPGGPGMPGLEEPPPPPPEPVDCPCWDYYALQQEIACNDYQVVFFGTDETLDNSGEDFAVLAGPSSIQLFAGNTFFNQVEDSNECNIVAPANLVIEPFYAVSGLVEDQCRLDVLELIDEVETPGVCEL